MMTAKRQINIRITPEAFEILERLVEHFTIPETGRNATQAEIFERALRALADRENLSLPGKKKKS